MHLTINYRCDQLTVNDHVYACPLEPAQWTWPDLPRHFINDFFIVDDIIQQVLVRLARTDWFRTLMRETQPITARNIEVNYRSRNCNTNWTSMTNFHEIHPAIETTWNGRHHTAEIWVTLSTRTRTINIGDLANWILEPPGSIEFPQPGPHPHNLFKG